MNLLSSLPYRGYFFLYNNSLGTMQIEKLFSTKTASTLGIDISSASVKILQLSRSNGKYKVEAFGVVQMPPNVMHEKEIKEPDILCETIEKALKIAKATAKQAILSVPDSAVISKVITMDAALSDDEMETQIKVEADKYIPYPIEEVNLDFHVLGLTEKDSSLAEVLLAAAKTSIVESRAEVVRLAGLKPAVVDVESFAIERACQTLLSHLPNEGNDKLVGILDLGAYVTNFTVLENFSTMFTREEEFGGGQLFQTLQEQYGMTKQDAFDTLINARWPEGFEDAVLKPFKQATVLQIKRSLQFFSSTSQNTELDILVLAGGVALLAGLAEEVETGVGVETIIANPFENMTFKRGLDKDALYSAGPSFMACCGLALRAFDI